MAAMMMIWVLMFAFFALANRRRRRWHEWRRMSSQHFPPHPDGWSRQQRIDRPSAELETYVDSLETRIAHLEERLDFTERLVTGSKGPVDWRADAITRKISGSAGDNEGTRIQGEM